MSRKYVPSNGTEGEGFIEAFCWRFFHWRFIEAFCWNCANEKWIHTFKDGDKKCDILSRSMIYRVEDEEYPKEWIYDENGKPTCTAWKEWDWKNGDPPE
jgi:hypothetical protein